MIQDLFINITILVSFLFIAGQLFRRYPVEKDSPVKIQLAIGGLFGLMGILLMVYSIDFTSEVIVDLRNLALICSAVFTGSVGILTSAVIIAGFRVLNFGLHSASFAAAISILLIALALIFLHRKQLRPARKFISMFLISMLISTVALIILLSNTTMLSITLRYFWMIHLLGGALAYFTCDYIISSSLTFQTLSYYRIMADNLLDMLSTHNLDGTYKFVSPSAVQLLGMPPEKLIGTSPYDIMHPDDLPKIASVESMLNHNVHREHTEEMRLRHASGDYIWVESTFRSVPGLDGRAKEIVCATRDISERKKVETLLRKQKEEAIEANRMKSQFLANMSHELRTPLNSIIGFTTRVLKKTEDVLPEMHQENLRIVKKESEHLLTLISDLLDYSKIEAGRMEASLESFPLDEVIDEAFSTTKGLMQEKGLGYEKKLEGLEEAERPMIVSDRLKLKQILINLLSNAFKYSDSGTVTLTVSKKSAEEVPATNPFNESMPFYQIDVADQGIGIPDEHITRIFDEFHQVDGSYTRKVGGTGLGLAITKKLVEILGGTIKVQSSTDQGTCFTILLPEVHISENTTTTAAGENIYSSRENILSGQKHSVIFIEDDFSTRRLYQAYLKDEGFIPVPLEDHENIVETIEVVQPIAVILDVMLPNRDGWDILREIKSHRSTKDVPVIISSVLNEKKIAYQLQANEYLVKPVMQEDLIEAIRKTAGNSLKIDILVADDDANHLKLVSEILAEEGFSFEVATDGKKAVEKLKNHNPDLVLLDLMMPELSGFEVLDWMRNRKSHRDIPVIIISAKTLTPKEREFLSRKANQVIQKSGTDIADIVQEILKRRESFHEIRDDRRRPPQ